jgi:hypothetical protein
MTRLGEGLARPLGFNIYLDNKGECRAALILPLRHNAQTNADHSP